MVSRKVRIVNPTGLHLRPAGNLCNEARKYESKVLFEKDGNLANAKSVLSVLGACVKSGEEIVLMCDGEGEEEALEAIAEFIENRLGET